MSSIRLFSVVFAIAFVLSFTSGCSYECERVSEPMGPQEDSGSTESISIAGADWVKHTIDAAACGPAYVDVVDADSDGTQELVVTRYGKGAGVVDGEVVLYHPEDDGGWSRSPILTVEDEVVFPAETGWWDVDQDGDVDAVVSTGWFICGIVPGTTPCGGMLWFEQTDGGWVRHDVMEPTQEEFFHAAVPVDIDLDGVADLVTVGETFGSSDVPGTAVVRWFRGTGSGSGFESEARVIGDGLGTLPNAADVDGDGDVDLYGARYFMPGGSFGWFENVAPPTGGDAGTWVHHVIDDEVGGGIDIELVPDLYGDGVLRAVGSNHTNTQEEPDDPESAVFVYTPTDDLTAPWSREKISSGIVSGTGTGAFAPGVLGTGDADGDGDIDLLVSGDGDPRVFFFEQSEPGAFTQHTLLEDFGQAGGMKIEDVDGDGDAEMVMVGYEDDAVLVFEKQ